MYSQERHTYTGQSIFEHANASEPRASVRLFAEKWRAEPAGNLRAGAAQGEALQCRQFSELRIALRTLPPQDRRAALIRTFLLRDFEGGDVSKTHAHI